ncbi:MAG: ferredoxin [Bdellovibrionales bacterium]|nr:ferredoxin [Bdellovibrionales bacterium]
MSENNINAKGPYYVDQECIACDACVLIAEKHFKIDEEAALAYVCKQPHTPEEISLCQEAMEACPVEAIHNDGQ